MYPATLTLFFELPPPVFECAQNYSQSDEGRLLIESARTRLAALHDDKTLELASNLGKQGSALLTTVLASKEGAELMQNHEALLRRFESLQDNEDARAIFQILQKQSAGAVNGAVDVESLRAMVNGIDLSNLTADNVAANSAGILAKLKANPHAQSWLTKGEALLGTLDKETGHKLLLQGQELLTSALDKETLQGVLSQGIELRDSLAADPEALLKQGRHILTNKQARGHFVRKIKDSALAFLLQYLPTIKVPPIHHADEDLEMTLSNIDLSGFAVPSQCVDVELNNLLQDGLCLRATSISCDMPKVAFKFAQLGFPYMSGDGAAHIKAEEVVFKLTLKIEFSERDDEKDDDDDSSSSSSSIAPPPAPRPFRLVASVEAGGPAQRAGLRAGDRIVEFGPVTIDSCTAGSLAEVTKGSEGRALCVRVVRSGSDGLVTLNLVPAKWEGKGLLGCALHPVPDEDPAAVAASSAAAAAAAAPAVMDEAKRAQLMADRRRWRELGRPRLVVAARSLTIGRLALTLQMDSWLESIYNYMIELCNSMVRDRIQKELLDALDERTGQLLATINSVSREYWPVLLSFTSEDETADAAASSSATPVEAAPSVAAASASATKP